MGTPQAGSSDLGVPENKTHNLGIFKKHSTEDPLIKSLNAGNWELTHISHHEALWAKKAKGKLDVLHIIIHKTYPSYIMSTLHPSLPGKSQKVSMGSMNP